MATRLSSIVATVALATALLISPANTAVAHAAPTLSVAVPSASTQGAALLKLVNAARASASKSALTSNATMTASAQAWASKLAAGTASGPMPQLLSAIPAGAKSAQQLVYGPISDSPAVAYSGLKASSAGSAFFAGDYTTSGIGWARTRTGKVWLVMVMAKYVPPQPAFTPTERKNVTLSLFDKLNVTRAAAAKAPLSLDAQLTSVAQTWANRMAAGTVPFMHNPSMSKQIRSGWLRAGENIAMRSDQNFTAIHAQWINSPGHYKNMIGDFSHVGVAAARASNGSLWAVQVLGKYSSVSVPYTATQQSQGAVKGRELANATRASWALPALKSSAKMNAAAQTWANRMALTTGAASIPSVSAVIPRGASSTNQAIAVGAGSPSAAYIEMRKNSTYVARVKGSYSHIGVGAARARDGRVYVFYLLAKYPTGVTPG